MIHKMFLPVFVQEVRLLMGKDVLKHIMLDIPDWPGDDVPKFKARWTPTNKSLEVNDKLFKQLSRTEDPELTRWKINYNYGIARYYANEFKKMIT